MRGEVLELLSWIEREPRFCPVAIKVWRTNRPPHSVWEDALDAQLIEVVRSGSKASVILTSRGKTALDDA